MISFYAGLHMLYHHRKCKSGPTARGYGPGPTTGTCNVPLQNSYFYAEKPIDKP